MSALTREWVCDQLAFTDDTQRSDLLDEQLTSTTLIAFVQQLLTIRQGVWCHELEILSVRTDHPTPDGPNGHQGGNAIDFAPIDDDADAHLIADVQACPDARGIGLGGFYQKYAPQFGGYNATTKLFEDNASDHLHVQVVGY